MSTETDTKAAGDGVAQDGQGTLSVTDNRTGRSYEIEITDGTVRSTDFRQIKVADDDFGLMTYDPAYMNTASCRSEITYLDGENGVLEYRGYPIEQLAEQSTYLEVAYLLVNGELPTAAQLEEWIGEITIHTFVHENVKGFMQGFRHDAHPMGMLLGSVGALSTFYPDANEIKDPDNRHIQTIRLIAKMPTLAAFAYRHNMGHALRLSRQRPGLQRQLPEHDVQDDRAQVRARSAARARSGHPLHPPRRPRAELLDERGAQRRLLAGRSVLGDRGRASRRSTARCTAAPTRPSCACCGASRARRTSPTSSRA